MLTEADLAALWTTLQLASVTTAILVLIGTPLAWWLSRTRSPLKPACEAFVALPLVLPPTVLGFYLLLALGPNGPVGGLLTSLGGRPLAFTFTGLVIGSVIYSLPFVVQPLQTAFLSIDGRALDAEASNSQVNPDSSLTENAATGALFSGGSPS